MYQRIKEEKALAQAEREKLDAVNKRQRKKVSGDDAPEVFRKPVDIRNDPR